MKQFFLILCFSMVSMHAMQKADQDTVSAYAQELIALDAQFKALADAPNPTCDQFNNFEALADSIHIKYVNYVVKDVAQIQELQSSIDRHWRATIRTLQWAHQQKQETATIEDGPLCFTDLNELCQTAYSGLPSPNRYKSQEIDKTVFFQN